MLGDLFILMLVTLAVLVSLELGLVLVIVACLFILFNDNSVGFAVTVCVI